MKEFFPNRLARLKRDLQIKLEIKAFPKCNIIIQDKFSEKQLKAKADMTGMTSVMMPYRGDWIVTVQYQGYEISDEIQCSSYGKDYFLDLTKTCSLTIQTDEGNLIELINGDERIEAIAIDGSFNEIVQGGTWTLIVKDADNADLKIMTRFEVPLDQREIIKEFYFPTITVSGDNADISVESGNISLNKIMNGGTVKFKVIPRAWTVKSSLGGDKDEKIVEVSEIGVNYEVELYFPEAMIKTDAGNFVEISESEKIVASGIATDGEFKVKLGRGNWKVKSCLNNNRDIYVKDEFKIEESGESFEFKIYLSTITISSDAWEGTIATATNYTVNNSGIIDANGSTVIKVGIGNWQISLSKGRINATAATIIKHSQNINIDLDVTYIYGVTRNGEDYVAGLIRTDDSYDFSEPIPFLNKAGADGYSNYGSPFDKLYPWSEMKVVEKEWGKAVVIPKFWYKLSWAKGSPYSIYYEPGNKWTEWGGMKIQISNKPLDGFSISPAHRTLYGSKSKVYVGRYKFSDPGLSALNYCSWSGKKPTLQKRADTYVIPEATDKTLKLHNASNIDFATLFTIWLLYLVEYAHFDSQSKIGRGGGNSKNGSAVLKENGYTDAMPYHTGTMKNSRTAQGASTQYRYIEGLWDNCKVWLDGIMYSSDNIMVLYPYANSQGWLVSIDYTAKSGFPFDFEIITDPYPIFIPRYAETSASGGRKSDDTYDKWNRSFPSEKVDYFNYLISGGSYSQLYSSYIGLFYIGSVVGNKTAQAMTGGRIVQWD